MKKILFTALLFLNALGLFAAGKSYETCMTNAKSYENQGKIVSALGSYYDAIEATENLDKKIEAYDSYSNLFEALKKGNPGTGDFTPKSKKENWKKIQQDYEEYWTANLTRQFYVGFIRESWRPPQTRDNPDYTVHVTSYELPKFKNISEAVTQGYKTAYSSDWTDMIENWPACAATKGEGIYTVQTDNAASDTYFLASAKSEPFYDRNFDRNDTENQLFDVTFEVTDKKGNLLLGPFTVGCGTALTLNNLEPNLRKMVKWENLAIKVTGVSLRCGKNGLNRKYYNDFYALTGYDSTKFAEDAVLLVKKLNDERKIQTVLAPIMNNLMVYVKGDVNFKMGSVDGEVNERPVHNVKVSSFEISKTEITEQMYSLITGSNPSENVCGYNYPVDNISWYDAIYFCNKLSLAFGLTPCYSNSRGETNPDKWNFTPNTNSIISGVNCNFTANGYRLPTEAEWEYAACEGELLSDYKYSGSNNIDDVAWCQANSGGAKHPVAQKKPNALGIYDMSGNVWEWCWDIYSQGYYSQSILNNPRGPVSGSYHVKRGGFFNFDNGCRTKYRLQSNVNRFMGLRIVRTVN